VEEKQIGQKITKAKQNPYGKK